MSTYTIGELADRSGFTASALRYYEGVGLVAPTSRTPAGYRLYDDRSLERLAFISRAKQLGCSLEEITDLIRIWDGEQCSPVQRRLHELVTAKIADARSQIAELTAFTAQLHTTAAQLDAPPADRPCGDGCACVAALAADAPPVPASRAAEPDAAEPIVCTLSSGALPDRLDEWRAILDRSTTRSRTEDGAVRIELDDTVPLLELTQLVAAEQRCCAFFTFAITVDQRGIGLEVHAPDGADDYLALFGVPT